MSMGKTEFVNLLSGKLEGAYTKKELGEMVTLFTETLGEAIDAEGKVSLPGFGIFEVKQRNARKGRNPQTGEELEIPAKKAVTFRASSALKEFVNQD